MLRYFPVAERFHVIVIIYCVLQVPVSLGGLPVFRFCTGFFIKPVFFSITGKPVFTTYQKAQYIIVNCNVEY